MIKAIIRYVICALFCSTFFSGSGQSHNFKTYGVRQGIPHSVIWGIHEDSRGYIWFGSYGRGVARFDGVNFQNYTMIDGLPSNIINDVVEDSNGNMWFAAGESGLSHFNGKSFTNYSTEDGLIGDEIVSLLHDSEGRLWIGTTDGLTLREKNQMSTLIKKDSLSANYVNHIIEDKEGRIWIAGKKLSLFENGKLEEVSSFPRTIYGLTHLAEDSDGSIYVSTLGGGLYKLDEGEWLQYTTEDGLLGNSIYSILMDKSGRLWIGGDDGVCYLENGKFTALGEKQGIPTGSVLNFAEDRFDNVWLSINEVGVVKYQENGFEHFTKKDGLPSNNIYSLFQIDSLSFWIGTDKGLTYWHDQEVENFNEASGFKAKFPYQIVRRRNGDFWFATESGIVIYDGFQFHKAESYGINYTQEGLADTANTWLSFGAGVIELQEVGTPPAYTDRKYVHHLERNGFSNAATGPSLIDNNGVLWISTTGDGLYKYENDTFTQYSSKDGLPSNYIHSLSIDKNENIWIGTSNGISRFDRDLFYNVTEVDGLNSNKANNLVFENDSILWVGMTQGVDRILLDEKNEVVEIKNYGFEDGFAGIETNTGAALRDMQGNIWMGTIDGLTKITPSNLKENRIEPLTQITDVDLFFETTEWAQYSDDLIGWTFLPKNLDLPYDQNHLTFKFIGINHISPSKIRYKWLLQDFDKEWSKMSDLNQITYSNIPPGQYTFMVKARNSDGVWNSNASTFGFSIAQPFWKTWWFRLLLVIIVFSLSYLGLKLRLTQVRQREQMKRKMVEMELKALRAQMNPHFTFNTMNSIQHFIKKNEPESAIRYISKFSKLMRMILDNSAVEMITIEREVQALKIYLEIESLRFDEKFDFSITIDPDLDQGYDKIPSMVLQPYIENAIWHGLMNKKGKGTISIAIKREENGIRCLIEDDGIGRKEAEKQRSSFTTDQKSYGMLISDERLRLLNQTQHQELNVKVVDIKDKEGKAAGTKVEVFISVNY